MSIQTKTYTSKKSGKTKTKYYAVIRNQATGKLQWSKAFDKRSDAKLEEARMISTAKEAASIPSLSFGEVAASWVKASDGVYANTTLQGYLWYLKKHLAPVFNDMLIDEITTKQIQDFINRLHISYSSETVNKTINLLSNIFNHAKNLGMISSSPVEGIRRKKVALKPITTWSPEDIKAFLDYEKTKDSPYYNMFLLQFSTGMRPSEVCGIWKDCLNGDLLILSRGYDRYNCVSDMKTGKSHRSLRLPEYIARRLNALMEASEGQFLFVNENGRPVNPNAYSKAFKRILRSYNKEMDASLPDVSLYEAARHSFGTNMIVDNEIPVSIVSSIMGNSERVLQDRYVHVRNEVQTVAISNYVEQIV